jgi:hypothetical protein
MIMEWTATFLIWITPLFGGQGVEASKDYPVPLPLYSEVGFPTEKGCRVMVRELEAHKMRYKVLKPCTKLPVKIVVE